MQQLNSSSRTEKTSSISSLYQRLSSLLVRPVIALPLLTLLALALRLYKLNYRDYFDDEVITTFVARQSLADIYRNVMANDSHPPFYHMLLHIWRAGFGESLTALRLFSVVASTACVPLVYQLGRLLASRSAGMAAAALMAIAPFQIYHGQQARMYPLLMLIVLLTTLIFIRAWRDGGWWRWLLFGLCAVAGFHTHIYFPLSLLALDLWAFYDTFAQRRFGKARWAGLIAAQALAAALFLPFLPTLFGTIRNVIQSFWIQSTRPFDWVFDLISVTNNALLTSLPGFDTPSWYIIASFLSAVAALLLALIYSLREARRNPAERGAWVLLHLLIWTPILGATVISLTIKPILIDRSLIGISSALYLLLAWMFVRFWNLRPVQIVALAFVASCLTSNVLTFPAKPGQDDLVRMADYLAREARPGDAIAYADWQSFDTAALTHPQQPDVYVLPFPADSTMRMYWQRRMEVMRWRSPRSVASVPDFGPRYRRVWLIFSLYTYGLDYHERVNQGWLEQHGRRVDRVEFPRAVVLLYEVTR